MSNRKRINLSISQNLYNEVEDAAKHGGFCGSCAFVAALVEAFIKYAKNHQKRPKKPENIEDEIYKMFTELEDGEQVAKEFSSHWEHTGHVGKFKK